MTIKAVFDFRTGEPAVIFVQPGELSDDPRLKTPDGKRCVISDDNVYGWITLPDESEPDVTCVVDVFADQEILREQGPRYFSFDPNLVASIEHRPGRVESW